MSGPSAAPRRSPLAKGDVGGVSGNDPGRVSCEDHRAASGLHPAGGGARPQSSRCCPSPPGWRPPRPRPLSNVDEEGRTSARDPLRRWPRPTAGRLDAASRAAVAAGNDPVTRRQARLHLSPLDPRERESATGSYVPPSAAPRRSDLAHAGERRRRRATVASGRSSCIRRLHALQDLEQARSAEIGAWALRPRASGSRPPPAGSPSPRPRCSREEGAASPASLRPVDRARAPGAERRAGRRHRDADTRGRRRPRLEVVVEALSTDAVRVRPGMPVNLSPAGARGRPHDRAHLEPAAFTEVLALGVGSSGSG